MFVGVGRGRHGALAGRFCHRWTVDLGKYLHLCTSIPPPLRSEIRLIVLLMRLLYIGTYFTSDEAIQIPRFPHARPGLPLD